MGDDVWFSWRRQTTTSPNFAETLAKSEDQPLQLQVFSMKTGQLRGSCVHGADRGVGRGALGARSAVVPRACS